jgi:hypothetical protein
VESRYRVSFSVCFVQYPYNDKNIDYIAWITQTSTVNYLVNSEGIQGEKAIRPFQILFLERIFLISEQNILQADLFTKFYKSHCRGLWTHYLNS